MDNFREIIARGSQPELDKMKSWLFQENIRLMTAQKELELKQERFLREKEQFQDEMKVLNRKMESERQRLKEENRFFDKKMEILQNGFRQLDLDRRRLEKDRARLAAEKEFMTEHTSSFDAKEVSVLFRGVHSQLALKKRYKDLIKIFHPDNVAGDKEVLQKINQEYDKLKRAYDNFKQA
jgi:uncharacterized protein (DUF3084 family)